MPASSDNPRVQQIRIKIEGTDIPEDLMDALLEAEVETTLHLPSMFTLRFHDDKLKWVDDSLLTPGKEVEILLSDPTANFALKSVLKGEITAIEPEFEENSLATIIVRGYDYSHRLHRGSKARVFIKSTDSDIATKIAGENSLSTQIESTSQQHEHVFQDHQSDFEFLYARAQRVGFEMFVDNKKLYFRKPTGSRGQVNLKWGETLRSFRPRMSLTGQVNEVSVRGWDTKQKQAIVGQASTSSISPQIGYGKWGGQAAQTAFGSAAKQVEVRHSVTSQAEAEKFAQSILDEINSNFIEAEGVAFGNPGLLAGQKVKVEKIGTRFSGTYMVTASRHIYSIDGYDTYFTVEGRRPRLMADMVAENMTNPDAYWGGVVAAVVTNNNDPDNLYRVKLKFPWLDDQLESGWARVIGLGAGNGRGLLWLPEVDDEVLVAFEQGDFNRPYVIGGLWNSKDAIPEQGSVANGKVEKRTLKTREGHILRLTDGSAACIEIIDSKTNTSIKLDTINKKITITSKGDIELNSTGNMTLKATGDMNLESTGNMNLKATGNLSLKGMNVNGEATSNLALKGVNTNVEATASLSMKANAMASLETSAILKLRGSLVNIN